MPTKKKAEAPAPAPAPTPAPADYLSIRRVSNGYIVTTSIWDDEVGQGGRSTTIHHTAVQALAAASKALIPAPKAPRKAKPATA